MITIIDCGSQLTHNIARRVREHNVYATIIPPDENVPEGTEGIIISGGPWSVYDDTAPSYPKELLENDVPILGICYGLQSIAYVLNGDVREAEHKEYGATEITYGDSTLFNGFTNTTATAWMSHGDVVTQVPPGFTVTARTRSGHVAAMERDNIYAVQFHPEVDHTEHGRTLLDNYLTICDASHNWKPEERYEKIRNRVREEVHDRTGIGGVSGGVDSTAASVLVNDLTHDYHPVFVDTGLLRQGEPDQVREFLDDAGIDHIFVDARDRFLNALTGVADPDEKRKIIGEEFINVFKEATSHLDNVAYLVQGTIYPDRIESTSVHASSSTIKRHHNVGGLPDQFELDVVEPFKNLFKDEVRTLARERLDIPDHITNRHPFPGPGLAIRIVGEVTREKLDILRQADALYQEKLRERGIYDDIAQAFAVLLPSKTVGVMGDAGTYDGVVALRAVDTNDFMTADWYDFCKDDLAQISNGIVNTVDGVNRVVYDVSQKPPATIEWE